MRAAKTVRTTTAEALLGLLSLGPMSGYEIRLTIDGSIGNFWRESYGQIYPTLKRLVAERLAKALPGKKADGARPERTVYELTAAGRKRLREWLDTPSTPQVPRNEMLLKIFFAQQGGHSVTRAQVEASLEFQERELKRYAEVRAGLMREHKQRKELPYWLMTLEYGELQTEARLRWCKRALEQVKKLEEDDDA